MSDSNQKRTFLLRTKLLPPRPVSEYLSRPRLTGKLEANLGAPITLVAADAGCGKTTLISDFIRSHDIESVWYQMDHTDADPYAFLRYVTEGIKGIRKGFGETVFSFLDEAKDEFLQNPERAVDLLLNEIFDAFEQPFILVLDDYHHIGRKTIVHKIVDRLLQYSADLLHIIVTTRDIPPLTMMKRRSGSSALVITREDLLFTDTEVQELFHATLDIELGSKEIAEYRERTHGWVTALQLVRQVAERELFSAEDPSLVDLRNVLQQSEKDIFDYFAEEVFSREPEKIQELLLYLSILDSMPLELCSRVFPDHHCSAVLPELVQKNVFVTSVADGEEDEEYRMHPLFQDFLRRRLRSEIGRKAVAEERIRIANFFLKGNSWEKAIPYLLAAEEFEKTAEVIAEMGETWLTEGKIATFNIYAEKIPLEDLEKHPRSLLHLAEAKRHQGDFEGSLDILNRALIPLRAQKDETGEAEALYSMGSLARRKGNIDEAFKYLDQAEELVPEESETHMKTANTRGLCFAILGDWANSEQQFRIALEFAEKFNNEKFKRIAAHNLSIPTGFRGEFGEALRWMKRMFRDSKSPLPQEAYGYLNVGRMHLYRGEFEEAITSLTRALELCQTYNMKPIKGEILEALGHYHRDTGDFQKAVEYFESSRKAYDDALVNRFRQEVEEEYATYFSMRGDVAKAKSLLIRLLEERKKINYEFGVKRVELGLAAIKLSEGETDGVIEELESLLEFHRKQSFNFEEAQNSLLLAKAYKAQKDRKKMFSHLQRMLDLTARLDYEYWLRTEIQKDPEFFSDEDIAEMLPPDLLGSEAEKRSEPEIKTVQVAQDIKPIADLTVNLLGSVEIHRDRAAAFAADAWTTRRSRDIFACIASSRDRRVDKDQLIDLFWAEDDFESIDKNFHPTISHIRKALNSNQSVKQNFLVFRDGAYQLNPDFTYSIDTEVFDDLIKQAEKAKRKRDWNTFRDKTESACEIYRGEFMTGVYDQWAEDRRIYYTEQFSRALSSLAEYSYKEKEWKEVIRHSNEVLKFDPFREDMHRLIMKTFAAEGSAAGVKKQFDSLTSLLKSELGVDPAPETQRLYRKLVK